MNPESQVENSIDALLRMGQKNQKRDAKERKNKNDKQTRKIEHSEKIMSDQLTLSTNNMKALLEKSRREFQAEVEKST